MDVSAVVWPVLALAAAGAGAVVRIRGARRARAARGDLTDEIVRRIEQDGRIELHREPELDMHEIRRAEEQFWGEAPEAGGRIDGCASEGWSPDPPP